MTKFFDTIEKTARHRRNRRRLQTYRVSKTGKCAICGKTLTTKESIALGIGPSHLTSKSPTVRLKIRNWFAKKNMHERQALLAGQYGGKIELQLQAAGYSVSPGGSLSVKQGKKKAKKIGSKFITDPMTGKKKYIGKKKAKKKKGHIGSRRPTRVAVREDDKRLATDELTRPTAVKARIKAQTDPRYVFERRGETKRAKWGGYETPIEGRITDEKASEFLDINDKKKEAWNTTQTKAKKAKENICTNITNIVTDRMATEPLLQQWADESWKDWKDEHQPWGPYGRPKVTSEDQLMLAWKGSFTKPPSDAAFKSAFKENPRAVITRVRVNETVATWAESSGDHTPRSVALQMRVLQRMLGKPPAAHHTESLDNDAESKEILRRDGVFFDSFIDATYELTQERFAQRGYKSVTLYRGMNMDRHEVERLKKKKVLKDPDAAKANKELEAKIAAAEEKFREAERKWKAAEAAFNKYAATFSASKGPNADKDPYDDFEWNRLDNARDKLSWEMEYADGELQDLRDDREYDTATRDAIVTDVTLQPISSFSARFNTTTEFGSTFLVSEVPVERIFSSSMTGLGCLNEEEFVVLGGDTESTVFFGDE